MLRLRQLHPLAIFAVTANALIAASCLITVLQLAPQFGDATSRHGVIFRLILWKLPVEIIFTRGFALAAKASYILQRIAFLFMWVVVAIWFSIFILDCLRFR